MTENKNNDVIISTLLCKLLTTHTKGPVLTRPLLLMTYKPACTYQQYICTITWYGELSSMSQWRSRPNTKTFPTTLLTLPPTRQGSRYGPLLCPSKLSSGGMQKICSWHPSMRHSWERRSSQHNHHIERRRRMVTLWRGARWQPCPSLTFLFLASLKPESSSQGQLSLDSHPKNTTLADESKREKTHKTFQHARKYPKKIP